MVSSLYNLSLFRFNLKMKLHSAPFLLCFFWLIFLHGADRKVTIIHKQGEFDCHTFRIPAMVNTNKGTLLAVYDMRYNSRRDLQGHMDIGLSRSTDGGETWARPVPIMDMKNLAGYPKIRMDAPILIFWSIAKQARFWSQRYGHMASPVPTNGVERAPSQVIQFTNLPSL